MLPSELLFQDYVLELMAYYPNGMWVKDYRVVRTYDSSDAIRRMKDYLKIEGFSVYGVKIVA